MRAGAVALAVACFIGVIGAAVAQTGGVQTAVAQTGGVQDRKCQEGKRAQGDGDVCVDGTKQAAALLDAVRTVFADEAIAGLEVGIWKDGEQVLTGALGEAVPGVPASRADHFRIGNVTESMTTTLLLMLADDGTVSLDDPVSKWVPEPSEVPEADQVTLEMLVRNVSGYPDFVTNDAFVDQYFTDPFQTFDQQQLRDFAFSQPMRFPPGTSWAFSDTNFLLLGEILAKAGGKPVGEQLQTRIFDELGLDSTRYESTAAVPAPTLHGYSAERGTYEDATFWNPSWARSIGNVTSTLDDLGRWARALGEGELISKKLHERQIGDENVGLGPLTESFYYAMGSGVSNGWIVNNPRLMGYTGIVAYRPEDRLAVVVTATPARDAEVNRHFAAAVFNAVGELLTPETPPNMPTQPRGASG